MGNGKDGVGLKVIKTIRSVESISFMQSQGRAGMRGAHRP